MSNEFTKYLSELSFSNISILPNKKKKFIKTINNQQISTKYHIKDGYINFDINLKEPKCRICKDVPFCSLKKCKHLIKLYQNVFNLSNYHLQFIWMNNNTTNLINGKPIEIKEADLECPICLDSVDLNTNNIYNLDKIYHCLDCGKFYHKKCMIMAKSNKCLNCYDHWKAKLPI